MLLLFLLANLRSSSLALPLLDVDEDLCEARFRLQNVLHIPILSAARPAVLRPRLTCVYDEQDSCSVVRLSPYTAS